MSGPTDDFPDYATIGDRKLWASESLGRIDRALRQLDRMQKAYAKTEKEFWRLCKANRGQPPRPLPMSWGRLHNRYTDHRYFFIVAARQAVSAIDVLRALDEEVSEIRQRDHLIHWRDIEEHWNDPALGQKLRASEKWKAISDESEPGLTTSARGDRLTNISGVSLKKLRKDLLAAREAALRLETRLYLLLYITPEEAAAILEVEPSELENLGLKSFSGPEGLGGGVRYFRELVERRINGRPLNPRWFLT